MPVKVIEFTNENYLTMTIKKVLAECQKVSATFSIAGAVTSYYQYLQSYPDSQGNRYCLRYSEETKSIEGFSLKQDCSASSYVHMKDYEFLGMDNIYPLLQECECSICNKKVSYTIQLGDKTIICRKCLEEFRESKQLKAEPA